MKTTKIVITTIESCADCPFMDIETLRKDGIHAYCEKLMRDVSIHYDDGIDRQCPLDDAFIK